LSNICKCGGTFQRHKQINYLGPDFTDCRDHLPFIPVKCDKCGEYRKISRELVAGGQMRSDAFNALIDQHGWPVPGEIVKQEEAREPTRH
jgi:hypothetical protein